MKRLFVVAFLLLCLVGAAAGCGRKGPPVAPEDVKPVAPAPSSPAGSRRSP